MSKKNKTKDGAVGIDFANGRFIFPSTSTSFPIGAIVRLKSGSPDLTVIDTCEDCGDVDFAYSDGVGVIYDTLPAAALVSVH